MTKFTPLAMTKRLVAFDTTSRGSNLDLIEFAASYLQDLGIVATLIHNAEKTKANLFATIGPTDVPGLYCPDTQMLCLWMARTGLPSRSTRFSPAAACSVEALVT